MNANPKQIRNPKSESGVRTARSVLECGGRRGTGLTPLSAVGRWMLDVRCSMFPPHRKAACALTPHPPHSKTWRSFVGPPAVPPSRRLAVPPILRLRSLCFLLWVFASALASLAATLNWTNTSGGNWSAGANWSPNTSLGGPAAGDDVFITAAGNYTVTQDVHVTIASLTLGGVTGWQTLTNSGAVLTVNTNSAVNFNGVLAFAGTLNGSGSLSVEGKCLWTAGNLRVPITITPGGVLELSSSADKGLTGALINQGTITLTGAGRLLFDPTHLENRPGALLDFQSDAPLVFYSGAPYVTNAGTIRKSAGNGANVFDGVPLRNTGTLEAQTGTISFATTGCWFDGGTQFKGAGTNALSGGVITLNGLITSDNLVLAGATIIGTNTLSGNVRWIAGNIASEGVVAIAPNGTLHITGSALKGINGVLNNLGTVRLSDAGTLAMGSQTVTATINNQSGGIFEALSDAPITWTAFYQPAFTNAGIFRKTGSAGTTALNGVPFFNTGTVDAQSGVIAFNTTGTRFDSGTHFLGAGTNLLTGGAIILNGSIYSENLEIAGAGIQGTNTLSGTVQWTSGSIAADGVATIATNGTLHVAGAATKGINGVLNNLGTVRLSDSGTLALGSQTVTAAIHNQPSGVFEALSDAPIAWTAFYQPGFTNAGTFRKSGGSGTTLVNGIPFANTGTVDAQTGTIAFNSTGTRFDSGTQFLGIGTNLLTGGIITLNGPIYSQNLEIAGAGIQGTNTLSGTVRWTSGYVAPEGAVTIATNGTLDVTGASAKGITGVLNNHGTVRLSDTGTLALGSQTVTATIHNQPSGVFDLLSDAAITWTAYFQPAFTNAGTFRKSGGTNLTDVNGVPFHNTGTLDVQSGTVRFLAAYTQIGGRLQFGLTSLTNFGRAQFAQIAPLTGTLGVNLLGGFKPKAGDAFAVIPYYLAFSGSFDTFDLPMAAAWQTNSSIYGANAVTLTVLNARPVLDPIPLQSGDEETAIAFTAAASDPDPGQTWTFDLIAPPPGATINTNTGAFSWTPTEAQGPATNVFGVQVTDNGTPNLSTTQSVTVVVNEVNLAPTLTVPPTQPFDEMTTLTVTNLAGDPDLPANTLRFSLVDAPPGVNLGTNTGVLTWTPEEDQGPSTNTISVAVTDDGTPPLGQTNSFTVIVREVNRAPSLIVPTTQTLDELTTLTVTNRASDPDLPANTPRFSLVAAPPGVNLNTNTGVLTWTPTEAQGPNTNTITIGVTDDGIPPLSFTNSFSVIVLESNVPPVLAAIPDLIAVQGVPLFYTNSASDADLPANALLFELLEFPPGMKVDATNGVLSWTPGPAQVPSTNLVTLRVTDDGQPAKSDTKSFSVMAYPPPFLTITKLETNVLLSWPDYATGFTLQQAAGLETPVFWADLTNAAINANGLNWVTNRTDASQRFYRLHYGSGISRPALCITRSDTDVIVSWPVLATDWLLYAATNATTEPGGWIPVPSASRTNDASYQFLEPTTVGNKFYRLHKP